MPCCIDTPSKPWRAPGLSGTSGRPRVPSPGISHSPGYAGIFPTIPFSSGAGPEFTQLSDSPATFHLGLRFTIDTPHRDLVGIEGGAELTAGPAALEIHVHPPDSVDTNTLARTGGNLLAIHGKVTAIHILSDEDAKTVLILQPKIQDG